MAAHETILFLADFGIILCISPHQTIPYLPVHKALASMFGHETEVIPGFVGNETEANAAMVGAENDATAGLAGNENKSLRTWTTMKMKRLCACLATKEKKPRAWQIMR